MRLRAGVQGGTRNNNNGGTQAPENTGWDDWGRSINICCENNGRTTGGLFRGWVTTRMAAQGMSRPETSDSERYEYTQTP